MTGQPPGTYPGAPPPTLPAPSLPHADTEKPERDAASGAGELPECFDDYRLLRPLGAGGMGKVFLARDVALDRLVAIKVMSTPSPAYYELIRMEAQAAAAIQHPNVVTIHRVAALDGRPYIVTEYIRGSSLYDLDKPVPWRRALVIGIDLARGLAAAHRHDVLHRDIKPANAILAATGQAKLIDFGVAARAGRAAIDDDTLVGTPPYMAPELWQGEPATPRSDIYSMGVLLYELCTGRAPGLPSPARDIPRLEDKVPDIDPRFAALVHRCLAAAPANRHASGDELRDALEALLEAETAHPLPAGNPYRGLLPFETAHRALFFGRSAEVRLVIERMRTQSFVLLAGESGVGKSSLARAGVLPLVADGALGTERTWTIYYQVPGRRPLTWLAHILAAKLGVDEDDVLDDIERADFSAVSRRLRKHLGDREGLVLFFDQLEELIILAERDEADGAGMLLACLIERTPALRILATARGDYLARLAALPGLGAMVERSLCMIRPLQADAVHDVVVAPARAKGVRFESNALIDRLVAAATSTDGALPLLQFALAQLWDQRDEKKRMLTELAFDSIGGVEGALSRHADGVMDAVLPDTRRAMRHLLVRLVTTGGTRARLAAAELGMDKDNVRHKAMDTLVAGRLVVAGELDGEPVYELAHEALISGWPTLRAWLDRASNIRVVRERLAAAAREWERAGRAREYLWGPRQLAAARAIDLAEWSAGEEAFLKASARVIRRARWERRLAVIAVLVLLASGYGVYRLNVARQIDKHLSAAERAMDQARAHRHALEAQHAQAMQALEADQRERAAAHWQQVLDLVPEVDAAYQLASRPLELALSLDPRRANTRALMGALLDERARVADMMGRGREREQYVQRLSIYDATAHARWRAPVPVLINTRPSAAVVIHAYVSNPDGILITEPWTQGRARVTPYRLELPPGSYLLTVQADDSHVEVRYPLVVRPGMPASRLDIARPSRVQVPPGFVYVPPGRFMSGFGHNAGDEALRRFYGADPVHERGIGAFLIARHECTFADWMAFLDACWPAGCDGLVPSLPAVEPGATASVAVMLRPHTERGWELVMRPTGGHTYHAARGQPLVYHGRQSRRTQRWERFPALGVSRDDVQIYLQWLRTTGRLPGARLCTPQEWERAARGADERVFPHGDRLLPDDANFDLTYGQVAHAFGPDEVGAHPRSVSPFGLHDMAGNAWELVDSISTSPDAGRDAGGDAGAGAGNKVGARMVQTRGGSYFQQAEVNAVVNQWAIVSNQKVSTVGFRLCVDAPQM